MIIKYSEHAQNIGSRQTAAWAWPVESWLYLYFGLFMSLSLLSVQNFRMETGNNWTDILHQDGSEFGDINIQPRACLCFRIFPFFLSSASIQPNNHLCWLKESGKIFTKATKPGWRVKWERLFVTFLHLSCRLESSHAILPPSDRSQEMQRDPDLARRQLCDPHSEFQTVTISSISPPDRQGN